MRVMHATPWHCARCIICVDLCMSISGKNSEIVAYGSFLFRLASIEPCQPLIAVPASSSPRNTFIMAYVVVKNGLTGRVWGNSGHCRGTQFPDKECAGADTPDGSMCLEGILMEDTRHSRLQIPQSRLVVVQHAYHRHSLSGLETSDGTQAPRALLAPPCF
ncbi:hypothetical protein EJ03DRAFT_53993 [Teratosphaeria nubilosa]|uniref:Uncharacterized protein n=1 Tax=Teratosphaeria nubilosa TaxID=161662 RepID=A0A6G1KT39_9PEZI|nr:hypothetical protein EJ03DRAFT_53993 [Teratosphaeria nubilosa]